MKNFDLEYTDHQFSYERIKERRTELNSKLFQINKDYCCKISGNPRDKSVTDLSKSILMRIDSVIFHYELLSNINIAGQQKESDYRGVNLTGGYLKTIQQDFLFDSIIFHAISYFDYFSSLISFVTLGKKKSQWNSIGNNSRQNDLIRKEEFAVQIDEIDRSFVRILSDYRSELIHYTDDVNGFSIRFDLNSNSEILHVLAPTGLRKCFKKEFKSFKKTNLDINSVGLWIIDNSLQSTLEISTSLLKYFENNRKISKENQPIFFDER